MTHMGQTYVSSEPGAPQYHDTYRVDLCVIPDTTRNEFAAFTSRSRNLGRITSEQALDNGASSSNSQRPIADITRNEFAAFSTRSRNLGRMTSEQALDYYLDQHNARSSQ